jgi:hypothetical protein
MARLFTKWRVSDTAVAFTRISHRRLPELRLFNHSISWSGKVSRNYCWLETRPVQHSQQVSGKDFRCLPPPRIPQQPLTRHQPPTYCT